MLGCLFFGSLVVLRPPAPGGACLHLRGPQQGAELHLRRPTNGHRSGLGLPSGQDPDPPEFIPFREIDASPKQLM